MTDIEIVLEIKRLESLTSYDEYINFGNGWTIRIRRSPAPKTFTMFCCNIGVWGSSNDYYKHAKDGMDVLAEMYTLSKK